MPATCPDCGSNLAPHADGQGFELCQTCGATFVSMVARKLTVPQLTDVGPRRRAAQIELSDAFLARYRLGKVLGSGAAGTVILATQLDLDRPVAIKFLTGAGATALDRFVREGRLLARIQHPGIVTIFEVGRDSGHAYLVTEYLRGGTLRSRIDGPMAPAEAVRIVSACLEAIAETHAQGIVHRDLKPENIFFDQHGAPKVGDFGIAKGPDGAPAPTIEVTARDEDAIGAGSLLTEEGAVIGTPRYMAPEQARGEPASFASDLYAVGVILYELLAGEPPFESRRLADLLRMHSEEPPPPLAAPPALAAVVHAALAKQPADRPPSARAMLEMLERALPEPHEAAHGRARGDAPPRAGAPGGRAAVASTLVALLALAGAALAWRASRPAPSVPPSPGASTRAVRVPERPPDPARLRLTSSNLWQTMTPFHDGLRGVVFTGGGSLLTIGRRPAARVWTWGPDTLANLQPPRPGPASIAPRQDRERWVNWPGNAFVARGDAELCELHQMGVVIHDTRTGSVREVPVLKPENRMAALSPDGAFCAEIEPAALVIRRLDDGGVAHRIAAAPAATMGNFAPRVGLAAGGLTAAWVDRSGWVLRWDARSPEPVRLRAAPDPDGISLGLAPRGEAVAVLTIDSIALWPAGATKPSSQEAISCIFLAPWVHVLPDARRVLFSSAYDLQIWDAKHGGVRRCGVGHHSAFGAVSPDGTWAVTAADPHDGRFELWDLASGRCVMGDPPVVAADISPDGSMLGMVQSDGQVLLQSLDPRIDSRLMSPDGNAAPSSGRGYRLSDRRTEPTSAEREMAPYPYRRLRFSPDGRHALVLGYENTAVLHDLEAGRARRVAQPGHGGEFAVAFADGAAVLSGMGKAHAIDLASGDVLARWEDRDVRADTGGMGVVGDQVLIPMVPPDSGSMSISARRARSLEATWAVTGLPHQAQWLTLGSNGWTAGADYESPSDSALVVAGFDAHTRTPLPRKRMRLPGSISTIAFHPSFPERLAAAGTDEGAVFVFDLATGARVQAPGVHADPVQTVLMDRAGLRLVSLARDGSVLVREFPR